MLIINNHYKKYSIEGEQPFGVTTFCPVTTVLWWFLFKIWQMIPKRQTKEIPFDALPLIIKLVPWSDQMFYFAFIGHVKGLSVHQMPLFAFLVTVFQKIFAENICEMVVRHYRWHGVKELRWHSKERYFLK